MSVAIAEFPRQVPRRDGRGPGPAEPDAALRPGATHHGGGEHGAPVFRLAAREELRAQLPDLYLTHLEGQPGTFLPTGADERRHREDGRVQRKPLEQCLLHYFSAFYNSYQKVSFLSQIMKECRSYRGER